MDEIGVIERFLSVTYGYGSGSGDGYGVKKYMSFPAYLIDGVQTVITRIRHGFAIGYILKDDLTVTPCVVAKMGRGKEKDCTGTAPCAGRRKSKEVRRQRMDVKRTDVQQ